MKALERFFRKHLQCRFGMHWSVEHLDPVAGICGPAKCHDCGWERAAMEWPKPPPSKCSSCRDGYDGTKGNGYQPCGCR